MVQAECRGGDRSQAGQLYRALRLQVDSSHSAFRFHSVLEKRCWGQIRGKVAFFRLFAAVQIYLYLLYFSFDKHTHDDEDKNVYGTITHNRARGQHLLEPMKAIVKTLIAKGKTMAEIGKELGMKPEEVFRLSDFTRDDFLKMMTKGTEYSRAQVITKY